MQDILNLPGDAPREPSTHTVQTLDHSSNQEVLLKKKKTHTKQSGPQQKGFFQIQLYHFYCMRGSFLLCSLCTYYKKIALNC